MQHQLFGVGQRKCISYLGKVLPTSGLSLKRYVTLYGSCDPGDVIMTSLKMLFISLYRWSLQKKRNVNSCLSCHLTRWALNQITILTLCELLQEICLLNFCDILLTHLVYWMFLQVITKDSHIVAMEFCRTEQLDDGNWTIDDEQTVRLKADFVISAFGSQLGESDGRRYHLWLIVTVTAIIKRPPYILKSRHLSTVSGADIFY